MDLYLQSQKKPELKFKIVRYDKETRDMTIEGTYGRTVVHDATPERLRKLGYTLVKEPSHAQQPELQA